MTQTATLSSLYIRQDYVKPNERELYADFYESLHSELSPLGIIEDVLAAEIIGASWRLRRCNAADGDLADLAVSASEAGLPRPYPHETPMPTNAAGQDPLLDHTKEQTRRSIERTRAAAHSQFQRAFNQLRTQQTERALRFELLGSDHPGLAECKKVAAVRGRHQREREENDAAIYEQEQRAFFQSLMGPDLTPEETRKIMADIEAERAASALNCATGQALSPQDLSAGENPNPLASNCSEQNPSPLASNCKPSQKQTEEDLADEAYIREMLTLDEDEQVRRFLEQRAIDEKELEDILNAA